MICSLFTICQFLNWSEWSECSGTCGNALGVRNRSRVLCCFPEVRTYGPRCLFANCRVKEEDYHDGKICYLPTCVASTTIVTNGSNPLTDAMYYSVSQSVMATTSSKDSWSEIRQQTRQGSTYETTVLNVIDSSFGNTRLLPPKTWKMIIPTDTTELTTNKMESGNEDYVYNASVPFLFKVHYDTVNRGDAYSLCAADGGFLVLIDSPGKQHSINANKENFTADRYWIGGKEYNNSGDVFYENGSLYTFSNWRVAKPDDPGNCIGIYNTGEWWDGPCQSLQLPYICEYDPYCFKDPPVPLKAVLIPGVNLVGSKRFYNCLPEHKMVGIPYVVCRRNRTWSDVDFDCQLTRMDTLQSSFLPSKLSVECNETSRMQGDLQIQNGRCETENEEMAMMYVNLQGHLIDILSTEFIASLYRLPPDTINDACDQLWNATFLVSIVYMTEVPPGSQEHEFNLGLVSTEFHILKETFCPILEEADVTLDPISVISNSSKAKNVGDGNVTGEVVVTFCLPVDDDCTANVFNDNITFSVFTNSRGDIKWDESTVIMELYNGRVYGNFYGLLQALTLQVSCDRNSTNFTYPECYENYGLITATTEAKTLNDSNGGWELPEKQTFIGIKEGQLVFKTKFFNTDGFNLYPIAPETINFDGIFSEDRINDSYIVLVVIVILMVTLIAVTALTLKLDHLDSIRDIYHRVWDSKLPCETSFLIAIQTGLTSSYNFRSPLYLEICGINHSSGSKLLNYSNNGIISLKRGCTTYFYMSVGRDIRSISHVKIWHGDLKAGILIDKLIIKDLGTMKCYTFLVEEWLSITKGWKLHTTLKPHDDDVIRDSAILFPNLVKHKLFDDLLLLSLFIRPAYSNFTRTQRLYCLSAIVSLSMLTSAMWFTTGKDQALYGFKVGSISINYKQVYTGIMASIMSAPPMILIVLCFRNYRQGKPSNHFSIEEIKRHFCLPKGFHILAWLLVLLTIILSSFLIFMYSLQWGGEVSNDWLVSVSFGFLFNIALGPLKITIISAILSGLFRRKSVSEISTLPILDVSMKPTLKGPFHVTPWPGDSETREQRNREREIKLDQKWKRKSIELVFAILYLTMPCLMAFHNNPNTCYNQNIQLRDSLHPDFKVEKASDIVSWLTEIMYPFMPRPRMNHSADDDLWLTSDGTSFLFGLIRIRQIRETERTNCLNISTYKVFSTVCSNPKEVIETDNFCTGWVGNNRNCIVHPWFISIPEDTSSSHRTLGEFDVYDGGGYAIDVNPITANLSDIAEDIVVLSWFDHKTRFVSVEASVSNPGTRLFSMISFKWEFSSIGGAAQKHSVRSLRLYPYIDPFDYFILIIQLSFIIFTLVELIRHSLKCSNTREVFKHKLFYLIKTVMVLLSLTIIGIYIYRIDRTIYTIERSFNEKEQFISLDQLLGIDDLYTTCLGVLIFCRMFLLLNYMTYNFHIYLLKNTINLALGRFASCIVLLGIAIIAFGSLEYLCLGRTLADYRSMYRGLLSLICATLSLAKLSSGKEENLSYFDKSFFIIFSLIVNLILLNLLISILNETLTSLKSGKFKYGSIPYFDRELNRFVLKKLSKIFYLCGFYSRVIYEEPVKRNPTLLQGVKRTISEFCSLVERISFEDALMEV